MNVTKYNLKITRWSKIQMEGSQKGFAFRNCVNFAWLELAKQPQIWKCHQRHYEHVLVKYPCLRVEIPQGQAWEGSVWVGKALVESWCLGKQGTNLTQFAQLQRPPPSEGASGFFHFYISSNRNPRTTQVQLSAFPSNPYGERFLLFFCASPTTDSLG